MENKILLYYSLFLVVLAYGVHYFDNSILFYILIACTSILIRKPLLILPVYFICCLSDSFFAAPDGLGSISRYLAIIFILSLLLEVFKKEVPLKANIIKLSLVITLIFFNFFLSVFSISGSFVSFFVLLQNILVLYLLSRFKVLNLSFIFRLIYYAAWLVICFTLVEVFLQGISIITIQTRFSISEEVNENSFGMMLAQLGVICFIPIFRQSRKMLRSLSYFSFPIILFLIVITGSRSALLAYLVTFIIGFFFLSGNKKRSTKIALGVFVGILLSITWSFLVDNIPFMYRYSFSEGSDTGGVGNRLNSINLLFKYIIPYNLFFGVGLGGENTIVALQPYGYGLKPAHNILIDVLTQIGIIGLMLYSYLFVKVLKNMLRIRKANDVILLPICIILAGLINGIGETVFFEKFLWNGFALGAMYYNNILETIKGREVYATN